MYVLMYLIVIFDTGMYIKDGMKGSSRRCFLHMKRGEEAMIPQRDGTRESCGSLMHMLSLLQGSWKSVACLVSLVMSA